MSVNSIRKTAQLVRKGNYREAQGLANAWESMLKKGKKEDYDQFKNNISGLNNTLKTHIARAQNLKQYAYNDDEEILVRDCEEGMLSPSCDFSIMRAKKRAKERAKELKK